MTTSTDLAILRGGVTLSDKDEQARRAVKAFRAMQPALSAYARVLTKNASMRVEMAARDNGSTDGKRIYFRPPMALGDNTPHDRRLCDKRDENRQLLCKACRVREDVLVVIYHEIAHNCFDSFAVTSDSEKRELIKLAIAEHGGKYAEAITKRIESAPSWVKDSYIGMAGLVSEFLPLLVNALEDARVNRELFKARKGTKTMFDGNTWRIFTEGVEQKDAAGKVVTIKWCDYPLNTQALVGVFCKASGYDFTSWFAEDVVDALKDEDLTLLVNKLDTVRSAKGVYHLSFPVLERLRELGFCKLPDDPEDEPSEDKSDNEGDPSDKEADDDASSEDGSGGEDSSPDDASEPDPSDDEGDGSEDDGDSSSDEAGDAGSGGNDSEEGSEADSDSEESGQSGGSEGGSNDTGEDSERSSDESESSDTDDATSGSPSESGTPNSDRSESSGSDMGDDAGGDVDDEETEDSDSGEKGTGDIDGPKLESGSGGDQEAASGGDSSPGGLPDERGDLDGDSDSSEHDNESGREGDLSSEVDGEPGDRDAERAEELDDEGDPFDSGADDGTGGVEVRENEANDDKPLEYGTPADAKLGLLKWGDHEEKPKSIDEAEDEARVDKAIIQGLYFETPSRHIWGVREHEFEKPIYSGGTNMSRAWDEDTYGTWGYSGHTIGKHGEISTPESILGPALLRMRVAFSDNARGKIQRNLKSGRVNAKVLGKRAFHDDPRLFHKKVLPGKKSYFVVIGMDVSGSTAGTNILLEKQAVAAQADLLARMGIDFSIYAHSGNYHDASGGRAHGLDLDIYLIKKPDEPWDKHTQIRLAKIGPDAANLDGHSLEYYRKICDAHRATDKVIMYYSDGKMPAENHDEELEILQREIRICKAKGYTLMGVGIRTDSPARHGLDTVQVDKTEDVVKVVKHLEKRLLQG